VDAEPTSADSAAPMAALRFATVPGWPSGARVTGCTLLTLALVSLVLTVVYVGAGITDDGLGSVTVLAAAVLTLLYAPLTLWSAGWWIAVLPAVGAAIAAVTHRYRITGMTSTTERTARTVFTLLTCYGAWVLLLGFGALMLTVGGGT
jgi:hypothetical protein